MTVELVLATEANLMVFTAWVRAFEVLGLDAMYGRGMAFEVAPVFGEKLAVDLTASIISGLAVIGFLFLVPIVFFLFVVIWGNLKFSCCHSPIVEWIISAAFSTTKVPEIEARIVSLQTGLMSGTANCRCSWKS